MKDTHKNVQWYQKLKEEDTTVSKPNLTKKEIKAARKHLSFERHIEESYRWIHEIAAALGDESRLNIAYQALRGVLFAMRDRMTPAEVFQFSAQLPVHIRGIFFEGYSIKDKPQKYHSEEFLKRIEEMMTSGTRNPKLVFQSVLRVLYSHVTVGELRDIYVTFPGDIQGLWDEVLNNP
ncbi:MAG: DUF2267 domain-containing protein [Balneolaceae bacterium]|jgi:uncharacterized protein (DUF2267 family)